MEEGESNDDMQSQPNQQSTSTATRDQRTNETNERLPDWPTTPFNADVYDASLTNSINKLTAEVSQLRQQLKEKDDKIAELHSHVLYVETELPLQSKKRKYSRSPQTDDDDGGDETNNLELENLKKENEQLKKQLDQLLASQATNKSGSLQVSNQNDTKLKDLDEKLVNGLEKIQANLEKMISSKLEVVANQTQEYKKTSYAAAVGTKDCPREDLKAIMMETKNAELTEEAEKKRRGRNLIIHGVEEKSWGSTGEEEDKLFVKKLITNLQVGAISADTVERLGPDTAERENKKTRPLKVVLKTEEEQQKILRNLRNLKGNVEYFGISIKEDYTYNERVLIRGYVEKAKAMNALEETKMSDTVWRVRGTPKNGLILKRFTKIKEAQGQNRPSTL